MWYLAFVLGFFAFVFHIVVEATLSLQQCDQLPAKARAHKLDKWIQITFDEREETCAADNSCSGRGVIFCILLGASAHFLLHSNTLFFHIHKAWCVFAFLFTVSVKNFAYFFFLFGWKQLL